jgi:hypothetical protein
LATEEEKKKREGKERKRKIYSHFHSPESRNKKRPGTNFSQETKA